MNSKQEVHRIVAHPESSSDRRFAPRESGQEQKIARPRRRETWRGSPPRNQIMMTRHARGLCATAAARSPTLPVSAILGSFGPNSGPKRVPRGPQKECKGDPREAPRWPKEARRGGTGRLQEAFRRPEGASRGPYTPDTAERLDYPWTLPARGVPELRRRDFPHILK